MATLAGDSRLFGPYVDEAAKTANYPVVAADNGKLFTTTGASGEVDFTLPLLSAVGGGFHVLFVNAVDQIMKVLAAGSDVIIADGLATAVSISFQTTSHKIGGTCEIWSNKAGTAWYCRNNNTTATIS